MKITIEAISGASVGWIDNERVELIDAVQNMVADLPEIFAGFNRKSPKDSAPDVIVDVDIYEVEASAETPYLTIMVKTDDGELADNRAITGNYDLVWRAFTQWFSDQRYLWPANWSYDHNDRGMSNMNRSFKSWPESTE